jgi:hypothetical protein
MTYLIDEKLGGVESGIMDAAEHLPPPPSGARTRNLSNVGGVRNYERVF